MNLGAPLARRGGRSAPIRHAFLVAAERGLATVQIVGEVKSQPPKKCSPISRLEVADTASLHGIEDGSRCPFGLDTAAMPEAVVASPRSCRASSSVRGASWCSDDGSSSVPTEEVVSSAWKPSMAVGPADHAELMGLASSRYSSSRLVFNASRAYSRARMSGVFASLKLRSPVSRFRSRRTRRPGIGMDGLRRRLHLGHSYSGFS